jgi:hypothetical protein
MLPRRLGRSRRGLHFSLRIRLCLDRFAPSPVAAMTQ